VNQTATDAVVDVLVDLLIVNLGGLE